MCTAIGAQPRPPAIRGLLFDLDGTLVDSEHLHYESTAAVLAARGVELRRDQFEMYAGWEERACWLSLNQRFGLAADPAAAAAERTHAYVALVRQRGLAPLPGVAALLAWSRGRGLSMAVASSLPREQIDASLEASRLAGFLPVRRSGHDDVAPGRGKPAPDVYLAAAAALQVDPAACAAFEDSPTGVRSARDAGCFVIAVASGAHAPEALAAADVVCATMTDALMFFRGWLP